MVCIQTFLFFFPLNGCYPHLVCVDPCGQPQTYICIYMYCECACVHVSLLGMHAQPHHQLVPGIWSCSSFPSVGLLGMTSPNRWALLWKRFQTYFLNNQGMMGLMNTNFASRIWGIMASWLLILLRLFLWTWPSGTLTCCTITSLLGTAGSTRQLSFNSKYTTQNRKHHCITSSFVITCFILFVLPQCCSLQFFPLNASLEGHLDERRGCC